MKPCEIRIILDTNTSIPNYLAMDGDGQLLQKLTVPQAMDLLRKGTPFVVAIADPKDKNSHYETINQSFLEHI